MVIEWGLKLFFACSFFPKAIHYSGLKGNSILDKMIWPLIWLCGTVEGHFRLWQFYETLSLLWVLSVALKCDKTHGVYCPLTCT